jgi:hypothetical protein
MQKTSDDSALSLTQRIYIISDPLRTMGGWLIRVLVANLVFLSIGWWAIYTKNTDIHGFVYIELSLVTIFFLAYYLFVGPRTFRHLKEWIDDYLEQTYTIVFNTTVPQGNTTGEKILNLARQIFPELTPEFIRLSAGPEERVKLFFKRKFGKSQEMIISQGMNYKLNSYVLDVAFRIPLDGYFIVKDFKDRIVTLEDMNYLIKIISLKFSFSVSTISIRRPKDIFRVICVAKTYDAPFLNRDSLEKLMTAELKANFKIDLILEEEVGYSVLWVGR